jgi:hypothetical protein
MFLIAGCEPDDICIEGIPGTPQLIIVFYDNDNPDQAKEELLYDGTTDSIAIPLKIKENSSTFSFISTDNNTIFEELLRVDYTTNDEFISRACGFKTSYKNISISHLNSATWIKNIKIITDSISNINKAHVKILH